MLLKTKMSFPKLPRITAVHEVMKHAAKLPSPGDYHHELSKKAIGNYTM